MAKALGLIINKGTDEVRTYYDVDENGFKILDLNKEENYCWVSNSMWEKIDKQTYESVDQEIGALVDEDIVNHPPHYNAASMETIEIIKVMTEYLTGIEAVCVGNIVKYTHRFKHKNGVEDLKKARWYLDRLIGDEQ